MELRRAYNGGGNGTGERDGLLLPFARVVGVAADAVDAHDREHDVVPDPRPRTGGDQVAGRGAEGYEVL